MNLSRTLLTLTLAAVVARGQDVTEYTDVEIQNYLDLFKKTYKDKKVPADDAVAVLENLQKAFLYLESLGANEVTKEQLKLKERIIKMVARGLSARKRDQVNLECAKVLGKLADKEGAKPLIKWMERTVLKDKSPNPSWVREGFRAMAHIGGEDKGTLDLMRSYATGKHQDSTVADNALMGVVEWRHLKGKNRKEMYGKIQLYMLSLWSGKNGTDVKKRATYEARYNTVEDSGLSALWQLSGNKDKFANPVKADEWWKQNKKRKWEDYEGPRFRKKKKKEDP